MAFEAAPWPVNPNRRSGHQQLVGIVDPPEGFGVLDVVMGDPRWSDWSRR